MYFESTKVNLHKEEFGKKFLELLLLIWVIFISPSFTPDQDRDSPTRCLFQCWNKYYLACYRGR